MNASTVGSSAMNTTPCQYLMNPCSPQRPKIVDTSEPSTKEEALVEFCDTLMIRRFMVMACVSGSS